MTASERRLFWIPARPYPRNKHAVGDADIDPREGAEVIGGVVLGHQRRLEPVRLVRRVENDN